MQYAVMGSDKMNKEQSADDPSVWIWFKKKKYV